MIVEQPETFATLLRRARRAAGLTQEALAERSGLSVRGIQDLERGMTHPLRDTVARFDRALGLAGADRAAFARAGAPRPPAQERQRAADATRHGLPVGVTSFIGRECELETVRRLVATTRLLTLTGPGGAGKTRLALETARQALPEYRDGVAWVELAPLVDPALAPQTVAASVGVQEQPGEALLTTLQGALRSRQLLLLLDNCEHLRDACAQLVEALLRTCPDLRVLATSREALGITGERSWPVPSLAVPEEEATPELALRSAAVRLFVERAQAVQPHFALTSQNVAAVVQICRRLDGIPLALELAAARLPALTVEQIVQRLHQRFHLLTRGSRTAPPRHQTLRSTIDWSYDLLSAAERTLFYRLSVFAGGWTLDAAETVGASEGIGAEGVLDVLSQLVAKSLVLTTESTASRTSEVRYHMLETLQDYGLERLEAAGEADLVRGRQRDWARSLVERAYLDVMSSAQVAWRTRLKSEHDNLRAVLAWCLEHDTASGLQMAW